MRVAFLGPPGAGKGTQARELAREWGVPHIATGDILREAVAAGTPLGTLAKRHMDRGELVPDEVVAGVMAERLKQPDAAAGFLLDGFPRTEAQADFLEQKLKELDQPPLERVLFFDVPKPELLRRLTGRRVCRRCATSFHLVSAPPKRAGVCDACGGELYQRDDDAEGAVRTRLDVYRRQTAPLLQYYRDRSLLTTVGGAGSVEAVRKDLREAAAGRR